MKTKGRRKRLTWFRRIALVLSAAILISPMQVGAASKSSKRKKALKAYGELMEQYESSYKFAVAYIDKDSVPELVVRSSYGSELYIYTYKKGKATKWNMSDIDGTASVVGYYPKKSVLKYMYAHYSGALGAGTWYYYYYRLSKGKFKMKMASELGKYYYLSNWKKVSHRTFQAYHRKYIGNTAMKKFKFYKNSLKYRKKYLGMKK